MKDKVVGTVVINYAIRKLTSWTILRVSFNLDFVDRSEITSKPLVTNVKINDTNYFFTVTLFNNFNFGLVNAMDLSVFAIVITFR